MRDRAHYSVDSIIYNKIEALNLPEADRRAALGAMHNADLLVDAFSWIAKKVEQTGHRLFLRPSLKA